MESIGYLIYYTHLYTFFYLRLETLILTLAPSTSRKMICMSQTTEKRSIGTKIKFFLLFRQLQLIFNYHIIMQYCLLACLLAWPSAVGLAYLHAPSKISSALARR